MKHRIQFQYICFLLLIITGCSRKDSVDDSLFYYLLVGNIETQNDISSVSGMPFTAPVTVYVNNNPIRVTVNQSMIFATPHIRTGKNSISIATDSDQSIGIGIYVQNSNTISKEMHRTSLTPSEPKTFFKINQPISEFRSLPSKLTLPANTSENRNELLGLINNIHENIQNRNGLQVVEKLYEGKTMVRKQYKTALKEHDSISLQRQIESYSRNDFNIEPLDLEQIEFVWGDSTVLAYNKKYISKSFPGLFEYEILNDGDPMPTIESLTFIFVKGQWVIW